MNWILFISTFLIGAFFGLCVLALFVANHTSDSVSMEEYKELERELSMMYEDLGEDPTEWFTYDNGDKAQWYTNIWYRLNGESTLKSMEG